MKKNYFEKAAGSSIEPIYYTGFDYWDHPLTWKCRTYFKTSDGCH